MLPEQMNINCSPFPPIEQCLLTGGLWTAADRIIRGYNKCMCVCMCARVRASRR